MDNYIGFEIAPLEETTEAIMDLFEKEIFYKEVKESYIIDIENQLETFLTEDLSEGMYCLIEYPYVDKLYRDSFYHYFSSKHYSYKRDTIRVSLFKNEISEEMFLDGNKHKELEDIYLGYFIVRPLRSSIFGRSHINPEALTKNSCICSFNSTSMIFGVKLTTKGFPHCSQDSESISCAETTIWSLMEYFGNRYAEYKPTLPSKIISTLKSLSFQRQLPSNGLTINQISYALKEFGFGTRIYAREYYASDFDTIANHFIESGIPVVLGLETVNLGHATIAIGRTSNRKKIDSSTKRETINIGGSDLNFIDFANTIDKIIVQDDNLSPYAELSIDNIGELYEEESEESEFEVKFLIIPLYPKIYLEATIAKQLFLQFIKDDTFGYPFKDEFVFRMFLASSRSFKTHIAKLSSMSQDLKLEILMTKMPKFIWCAEIYDVNNGINIGVSAKSLLILDATEANNSTIDSLIFAGYEDKCIFLNENKFVALQLKLSGYKYYSNLT
ncbi:hypothetical protein [Tenacibaculum maritimum]|uniref:hypothetical protein n=1 Tax=Tenacibaculum maritimum TaxID=107401 RepID=UPI000414E807|nr:hypothetical protein [Tenacibaculum maritimum]